MNKAPKIGQRVRYHSVSEWWDRTCTGTVRTIYQEYDDEFDEDTGDLIRRGPLSPERDWFVGVQVDAPLPDWWPYVGTDRFAPCVAEIEPI